MIYCPFCKGTLVGRIGQGRYYCRNCYYEFKVDHSGIQTFELTEDGGLKELMGR